MTYPRKSVRREDVGKRARLVDAVYGETHAEGRILDYTEAPSITIETDTGARISWRADLSEVIAENNPSDLIDSFTPMCSCGHTRDSHTRAGCFACAGPPCDTPYKVGDRLTLPSGQVATVTHLLGPDARGVSRITCEVAPDMEPDAAELYRYEH